jgi:hypothetical protein
VIADLVIAAAQHIILAAVLTALLIRFGAGAAQPKNSTEYLFTSFVMVFVALGLLRAFWRAQ